MDIGDWLRCLGLERHEQAFRDNDVDAEILVELTEEDLIGLGVSSIGHRRKLLAAITALRAGVSLAGAASSLEPTPSIAPVARSPDAERRQLTVMFVDLVGSTALSSRLDPEDLREIIRAYHDSITGVVRRFGGHLAKFLGDGVLAYFGYPRAHEDDAERGIRAGLEAVEAVKRLSVPDGPAAQARVGIATGLVVIGDLAEGASPDEVVGQTPNLAARLQTLAEPGTVVIAEGTRQLAGGVFEYHALGKVEIKGLTTRIAAYQVLGEGTAEGRFEARQASSLTPLVGREPELGLLIDRWHRSREGEGQMVLVSGEPGVGKSRLIQAFRERLAHEALGLLRYQCSPLHQSTALHPVIEQLERAAGFARDDPAGARLDKLEALLSLITDRVETVAPLFADLLGLPIDERYSALDLNPPLKKARTLAAIVDRVGRLAARQPTLILFEDVHWIDPTSLELLDQIVAAVPKLPVLAVVTFRPEFVPSWPWLDHIISIVLGRLGQEEVATLVRHLTIGKSLPPDIVEQIVAKTDGVPLFVEELTKVVLESGLVRDVGDRYTRSGPLPSFAIPSTLQDSLMARLDHLGPVKEIAQTSAAIGREFSYELLSEVSALEENRLRPALDQLVEAELVFRPSAPDASYTFKHALVRDAAYASMLKSKRVQLHARIAHVLEERFPDQAATHPELLAHHCTEAGLITPAIHNWQRAGEKAAGRSANLEAARHLQKGLTLLEGLPEGDERDSQELHLLTVLGPALLATQGRSAPAVERLYARARVVASRLGRPADLFPTVWGWWFVAHTRADHDTTSDILDELLHLAESEGEPGLVLQAHHAAWATRMSAGDLSSARDSAEAGIRLYRRESHSQHALVYGGHDPGVCGLAHAGHLLWLLGYPEQAKTRGGEALALARDLGHKDTLAHALWFACELHLYRREVRETAETAEALRILATEQGLVMYVTLGTMLSGWALAAGGQVREGLDQLRAGSVTWPDDREALAPSTVRLAEVCGAAGEVDEGLRLIDDALAQITRSRQRMYEAELLRLQGTLRLLSPAPDPSGAEASFRRALAAAREQNARMWELRAASSLARLWRDQGKLAEGRDLLAPVYSWFTEGFDTADLTDAKELLDTLT